MSHAETIDVRVAAIEQVTPQIKHFTLARPDGGRLPAFSGGSHIVVVMQGASRVYRNPYSLLSPPDRLEAYEIGVRRMDVSRGGSHYMHDQVRVGSMLQIAHPVNLFPLEKIARKQLLIAGGVGITPIVAQMWDLKSALVPYELHYAVRGPEHAAFRELLEREHPGRVHMYYDSAGQAIAFQDLLSSQPLGTHVYCCGPAGMIELVMDTARRCGWPASHLHWEQFAAPPGGEAFEVFLERAGISVQVGPEETLLEAIEAAGVDAPYLCRGGVCGFCRAEVLELEGELLHHDHFLSAEERASGKAIMPCVSRARCRKLVLDL